MIPIKESMTIEEARLLEGGYGRSNYSDEELIELALDNYNYCVKQYNWYKEERIPRELKEVATEPIEDSRIESFEDHRNRDSTFPPKFTAWSKNYVYVMGIYDGHDWIAKIARNPCDELSKPIGGG